MIKGMPIFGGGGIDRAREADTGVEGIGIQGALA